MVKKRKASTEAKKKGPKGKKARARAKLDRQWGEELTNEEGGAHRRRGESRLFQDDAENGPQSSFAESELGRNPTNPGSTGSLVDFSDDDASVIDENGAFSKLMRMIDNRKDDGSVSSDDDGSAMFQTESDRGNLGTRVLAAQSKDAFPDVTGESEDQDHQASLDLFAQRFSNQELLPEDDIQRGETMKAIHQTKKTRLLHLDKAVELQISQHMYDDLGIENSGTNLGRYWRDLSKRSFSCTNDFLKTQWGNFSKVYTSAGENLSPLQSVLHPFVSRYMDCSLTAKNEKMLEEIRSLTVLHVLNHVVTSRVRIEGNNNGQPAKETSQLGEDETLRDQGFTRPTVLVLLPTRGSCYKFVEEISLLLEGKSPIDVSERFVEEYGPPTLEHEENPDEKTLRRAKVLKLKGREWQDLFGDNVNSDDDFKIGLSFSCKYGGAGRKKESENARFSGARMKFYTDFYLSDIILASPLALKMLISPEEKGSTDFLSSIEICLVDQAEVLLMQNWDHLSGVVDHLNHLPQNNNRTDFSRVRNYLLASQASHWRQLICYSRLDDPSIQGTFKRVATSKSGLVKMRWKVSVNEASITNVIIPVRQVFQRINVKRLSSQCDDRIEYFQQKVLPQIIQQKQRHTMIYIPSYFDFVLIRNALLKREMDFISISEYSRTSETSRARARFLQGRKPLLLYTGRAHYFFRHHIKGVKHLIFYGLPEHSSFYSGVVNLINEGFNEPNNPTVGSCLALFTKYDGHSLERIVGSVECSRMLKAEKGTSVFIS